MPRPKESPSGKPSKPIASTQSLSAFVKGVCEVVRCPNASASSWRNWRWPEDAPPASRKSWRKWPPTTAEVERLLRLPQWSLVSPAAVCPRAERW